MSPDVSKALIRTILEHAQDFPWRMHELGLLGLRLGGSREFRLHVWDPSRRVGEPVIHDHPFDFTSTIVAGELTNTRYRLDLAGEEYRRFRYVPGSEADRVSDTVKLSATAELFGAGSEYRQLAPELHASEQLPGTVTVLRSCKVEVPELTVCMRAADCRDDYWVSEQARPATSDEIKSMTAKALDWF